MSERAVRDRASAVTADGTHRARPQFDLALALVALAVAFNLWSLRAEVQPGQYLNDSSIHASMVRWAEARIDAGHLPFDGWYPYLSLGASRFHHYQSLPHILTGSLSAVFGERAFPWTLYLLLSLWPFAVYWGARLLDLGPWPAAAAALVSPLLVSAPGLGYEYGSYTWRGSGAWSQLWGMWALPLAWGLSWRAVSRGRLFAPAAVAVGLTVCLHLLTGYLALLSLGVWVLLAPREFLRRLWRAAAVGLGALALSAWMLVPLVADAAWTTQDEFSRGTFYYDSFGARRVLGWLITGRIFDAGRLPIVSALVAVGVAAAVARFRREEPARAVLAAGTLSLLLFFGRPTLGPALRLLPGSSDLFLRRYISGVHLAGILLAGIGGAWLAGEVVRVIRRVLPRLRPGAVGLAVGVAAVASLAPAWLERDAFNAQGATWIAEQRVADATDGAAFARLVRRAEATGGGRIYAGLRSAGPSDYLIGRVPAYITLLNLDADAVGFTRPTWSLVSGVESRFDPADPAHYRLFNVRYVIASAERAPTVPGTLVARAGRHGLWEVESSGYLAVVDTIAPIEADRTNLALQMVPFLGSSQPERGLHPTISFGGRRASRPTLSPGEVPAEPPGIVLEETVGPADGIFAGRVEARRDGVVMLKASFDPRWKAVVDGVERELQMLAPGFPGVAVGPGSHSVLFVYDPYPAYPVLFLLGGLAVVFLVLAERRRSRRWPSWGLRAPGLKKS